MNTSTPNLDQLDKYLHRRAQASGPLHGAPLSPGRIDRAVVIPAMREADSLPQTLETLEAQQPPAVLDRTGVVVVVNRPALPPGAPEPAARANRRIAEDNQRTLQWLEHNAARFRFQLAWIDASSPGRELPPGRGVGMARKLGCDAVLEQLARRGTAGEETEPFILLHLDADTLADRDYLDAAVRELRYSGAAAGVVPFRHQPANDPRRQAAIDAYELYLRYYAAGLTFAGSPYAFPAVGSTMLCTAAAYVAAGGFPAKRQAGEDFYFLQNCAKIGGVFRLHSGMVYPSSRASDRVPFGTGPAVRRLLEQDACDFPVFAPEAFARLRNLLETIERGIYLQPEQVPRLLPPEAAGFFQERGFPKAWAGFLRQYGRTPHALRRAFHVWFDGLATLQFLRRLTASGLEEVPVSRAAARLLAMLAPGSAPPAPSPGRPPAPSRLLQAYHAFEFGAY